MTAAAALSIAAAAVTMYALGVVMDVCAPVAQLPALCAISLLFGAARASTRALTKGAVTVANGRAGASANLAAYVEAASCAAPVGLLLWGVASDLLGPSGAIYIGASASVAVTGWWLCGPAVTVSRPPPAACRRGE